MIKLGSNNIGQIYLGSNSIGKAYLGSNLVFQKGLSPTPTLIPYIRGGADGSYIDTGITADNSVKIIIWARNWNPSGGFVFGSRQSSTIDTFGIGTFVAQNAGRIRIDYGQTQTNADDQFANLSHYHKYELYQGVCKVDDVTIASATASTFSNAYNIHLFGMNTSDTHTNMSLPLDICACKIYKNDVLVRDYTATNSPSVGLYDAVSDTVFTNAGTGSFTYGTFNPNAYTPLEYITTSGSSYFITPAIGSYSLPIIVKFRPTSTTAAWFDVVGGRDATNRCQIFTGNTTISNGRLYAILGTGEASALYSTNVSGSVRNINIVVVKNNNTITAYKDNATLGSALTFSVSSSYSTGVPLGIGATWISNSSTWGNFFVGRIYYVGLGSYNLVPAKVNGVAGMYDTYNDTFYPSITSTPFTAGSTI